MLRVCSLAGEEVVAWEDVNFEGKSVRSLKTLLAKQIGVSRFRQRWLSEDHTELQDDDIISTASDVQLLLLDFVASEDEDVRKFLMACYENRLEQVEELLQKPLNPEVILEINHAVIDVRGAIVHNIINIKIEKGTALHAAARLGHVECVALLLEAGARKDVVDFQGKTALEVAASNGHSDIVELMNRTSDEESR